MKYTALPSGAKAKPPKLALPPSTGNSASLPVATSTTPGYDSAAETYFITSRRDPSGEKSIGDQLPPASTRSFVSPLRVLRSHTSRSVPLREVLLYAISPPSRLSVVPPFWLRLPSVSNVTERESLSNQYNWLNSSPPLSLANTKPSRHAFAGAGVRPPTGSG